MPKSERAPMPDDAGPPILDKGGNRYDVSHYRKHLADQEAAETKQANEHQERQEENAAIEKALAESRAKETAPKEWRETFERKADDLFNELTALNNEGIQKYREGDKIYEDWQDTIKTRLERRKAENEKTGGDPKEFLAIVSEVRRRFQDIGQLKKTEKPGVIRFDEGKTERFVAQEIALDEFLKDKVVKKKKASDEEVWASNPPPEETHSAAPEPPPLPGGIKFRGGNGVSLGQ